MCVSKYYIISVIARVSLSAYWWCCSWRTWRSAQPSPCRGPIWTRSWQAERCPPPCPRPCWAARGGREAVRWTDSRCWGWCSYRTLGWRQSRKRCRRWLLLWTRKDGGMLESVHFFFFLGSYLITYSSTVHIFQGTVFCCIQHLCTVFNACNEDKVEISAHSTTAVVLIWNESMALSGQRNINKPCQDIRCFTTHEACQVKASHRQ